MPIHRIPRAHLDEDLVELRKTGETVVSIVYEGDTAVVLTESGIETR
jgi:hypothetical protein